MPGMRRSDSRLPLHLPATLGSPWAHGGSGGEDSNRIQLLDWQRPGRDSKTWRKVCPAARRLTLADGVGLGLECGFRTNRKEEILYSVQFHGPT